METKKLNVTYQYSMIGTVTMDVPKDLTIEEAIAYAKERVNSLPLPQNPEYINDSCIVDEENCDFNQE